MRAPAFLSRSGATDKSSLSPREQLPKDQNLGAARRPSNAAPKPAVDSIVMPQSLLFYISGHGFGHARRMTQLIRAISALRPDIPIHIRSAAPARVFQPIPADRVQPCPIDSGMIEAGPLAIDRARTLDHLEQFMTNCDSIISSESTAAAAIGATMVIADIPFLAGDVADRIGVPCVGVSNFTWDWIYGELFAGEPRYAPIHERIVKSYARYSAILQLPFGAVCAAIRSKIPTPLIAPQSIRTPEEIIKQIGLPENDRRPRILFSTRGSDAGAALIAAAQQSPDFLFICTLGDDVAFPPNVHRVRLTPALDFSDLVRISDAVVSKLGYGIVAECIASRVRLAWPRRSGFAEDSIVERELPRHLPMIEIPSEQYPKGDWREMLKTLLAIPMPALVFPTNGAEFGARWICDHM
jgi:L-arabinokinase